MHAGATYMHMCVPYTQAYRPHGHMHEVNGLMSSMHIMIYKACICPPVPDTEGIQAKRAHNGPFAPLGEWPF